jgi:hypothetical protein
MPEQKDSCVILLFIYLIKVFYEHSGMALPKVKTCESENRRDAVNTDHSRPLPSYHEAPQCVSILLAYF